MANATTYASEKPITTAILLSLAAAIALGMTRFSYGMLLPPMRKDLDWTYFVAGSMNTANAIGYFIGAITAPYFLKRFGVAKGVILSSLTASCLMFIAGNIIGTEILLVQRLLAGISSSYIFISGGILAARLGSQHPDKSGFLLGIYYGGTGIGIAVSALVVPEIQMLTSSYELKHSWQYSWIFLGVLCLISSILIIIPANKVGDIVGTSSKTNKFKFSDFRFSLFGYMLFGAGYIGYMTFVIALLKEQGVSSSNITLFYSLLGLSVIASSRVWSPMLDKFRGGQSLAILNFLLSLFCLLPVLSLNMSAVLFSGIGFGGIFLSVVASTTALVKHNLPQSAWSSGISAFTAAFAAGQIVGPTLVGWISDGPGGLERGLLISAILLLLASIISFPQKELKL
ncbi:MULTISPECIES: YbfB/YjiJ family MFS transporter [Comamonas]|uniref:YbfB/YjiJ family MFS transporter n=1 Tax=Comamonas TaxID=283 RepID=UPI0009B88A44|nr:MULTISPECIES: YbfB/YjiJ family MFS transporter [Comamonas]MPT09134.1 YbfB/YjiJ family MFS transporter [Comamonas sp.]